jgi:hypothetical protein
MAQGQPRPLKMPPVARDQFNAYYGAGDAAEKAAVVALARLEIEHGLSRAQVDEHLRQIGFNPSWGWLLPPAIPQCRLRCLRTCDSWTSIQPRLALHRPRAQRLQSRGRIGQICPRRTRVP